jgi:hypothetical protein
LHALTDTFVDGNRATTTINDTDLYLAAGGNEFAGWARTFNPMKSQKEEN